MHFQRRSVLPRIKTEAGKARWKNGQRVSFRRRSGHGNRCGSRIPGGPRFYGKVLMVIGIKHLPQGRAEDAAGAEDRRVKGIGINNLVCGIINSNFAANTADNDETGNQRFFDNIEVLGKAAQGHIHILMRLREHINRHTIMTVELEPIDSRFGKGFILAGVEFHASFVDDKFTVLNEIIADILTGIDFIATLDRDI